MTYPVGVPLAAGADDVPGVKAGVSVGVGVGAPVSVGVGLVGGDVGVLVAG